jgi:hypothetical protein
MPEGPIPYGSERLIIDFEHSPRVLGHLAIEATEGEEMKDVLIHEADEEIVGTLKDLPEGLVLLGCGDDRGITHASKELAAEANRDFAVTVLGDKYREFSVDRTELFTIGVPTMILRGEHAKSAETFLLANFSTDKLTDPNEAMDIGRPYYAIDFTHTAKTIIQSRPEINYDPENLFAAMKLDIDATRAALAAHDGPANPGRITLIRYGDPEEALDYLRALQ